MLDAEIDAPVAVLRQNDVDGFLRCRGPSPRNRGEDDRAVSWPSTVHDGSR